MQDFIAQDHAGWGRHLRFTHVPSGRTLVIQPFMNEARAKSEILAFMGDYPTLSVHRCPDAYVATEENRTSSVPDFIASLTSTLSAGDQQ